MLGFLLFLYVVWAAVYSVQMFMGYGTAYRMTKRGGDNGVALFGWMIVFALAASVPGLGIYLWIKNKEPVNTRPAQGNYGNQGYGYNPQNNYAQPQQPAYPPAGGAGLCRSCGASMPGGTQFCPRCGAAAY